MRTASPFGKGQLFLWRGRFKDKVSQLLLKCPFFFFYFLFFFPSVSLFSRRLLAINITGQNFDGDSVKFSSFSFRMNFLTTYIVQNFCHKAFNAVPWECAFGNLNEKWIWMRFSVISIIFTHSVFHSAFKETNWIASENDLFHVHMKLHLQCEYWWMGEAVHRSATLLLTWIFLNIYVPIADCDALYYALLAYQNVNKSLYRCHIHIDKNTNDTYRHSKGNQIETVILHRLKNIIQIR